MRRWRCCGWRGDKRPRKSSGSSRAPSDAEGHFRRVIDPAVLLPGQVLEACRSPDLPFGRLVVQFSRPDAYSPPLLEALNEACRSAGDRLQVRFYGHDRTSFDATALRHLPDVRDLAVDCLTRIANEEEIGHLPQLRRLSFGVFDFDRPDFLGTLDLAPMEWLSVQENQKRNLDLAPLSRCEALETCSIGGHAKGIGAMAGLPRLRKLTLRAYAKRNALDFVSALPALKSLELVLGGRDHLDDLSSATLETLQILMVRGVSSIGDLSRLPALAALRVEDQIRLERVDLSGARLERLSLFNCKTLAALPGLDAQDRLREIAISGTLLDLDALRDRDWPASMRSVRLFSGSRKWNDDTAARLARRGLDGPRTLWL